MLALLLESSLLTPFFTFEGDGSCWRYEGAKLCCGSSHLAVQLLNFVILETHVNCLCLLLHSYSELRGWSKDFVKSILVSDFKLDAAKVKPTLQQLFFSHFNIICA